jgi:hypothetical protein
MVARLAVASETRGCDEVIKGTNTSSLMVHVHPVKNLEFSSVSHLCMRCPAWARTERGLTKAAAPAAQLTCGLSAAQVAALRPNTVASRSPLQLQRL